MTPWSDFKFIILVENHNKKNILEIQQNFYISRYISLMYLTKDDLQQALSYNIAATDLYNVTQDLLSIAGISENRAHIAAANQNYTEALVYSRKALEIRLKVYQDNPYHHSIADSYYNLSDILCSQSSYAEAMEYAIKALGP